MAEYIEQPKNETKESEFIYSYNDAEYRLRWQLNRAKELKKELSEVNKKIKHFVSIMEYCKKQIG